MTPMQDKLYKAAVDNMRREVAAATSAGKLNGGGGRGRGRGRKGLPPAVGGSGAPELLVAKLGSQRVNNIFTHLRKVWGGLTRHLKPYNHPLLVSAHPKPRTLNPTSPLPLPLPPLPGAPPPAHPAPRPLNPTFPNPPGGQPPPAHPQRV